MTKTNDLDPAIALARATRPLLELFAELDAVFDEHDAMSTEKRQISLGRCYRAYKSAKKALDPDYRERKVSAKVGDRFGSTDRTTTVQVNDRVVLRTRRRRKG